MQYCIPEQIPKLPIPYLVELIVFSTDTDLA